VHRETPEPVLWWKAEVLAFDKRDAVRMSTHAPHAPLKWSPRRALRFGGSTGNEVLTSINAVVLIALIAVQLITVLSLESMITAHLFVGVVLLGPVALKLATTGYRFLRYYTGARDYREKGPPPTFLRALAPIFVAATIGLFASGVVMLLNGDGEGVVRGIHTTSFWIWIACLGLHVLFNGRQVLDNLRRARLAVSGAELRAMLVLASILGGLMVALSLIGKITGYEMSGD
jgi:hypothetical protein